VLPNTEQSLVLRTDFSDEQAWESLCAMIREPEPEDGFQAYVDCVSDRRFEGATPEQILEKAQEGFSKSYLFIVDKTTLEDSEHPVLVMDLLTEPGRTFRVIPSEMWSVENNLSLANMDFAEFADAAGVEGIFRGDWG
jgi:hypothetical protein